MFKIGDRVVQAGEVYKIIEKSNREYLDDSGKEVRNCEYIIQSESNGIRHKAKEESLQLASKYHIVITEDGKEIVNKDIDAKYIGHLANPVYFKLNEGVDIISDYIFYK